MRGGSSQGRGYQGQPGVRGSGCVHERGSPLRVEWGGGGLGPRAGPGGGTPGGGKLRPQARDTKQNTPLLKQKSFGSE